MPADLIDAMRGLGSASGVVFLILWWLERVERKTTQENLKTTLEENKTIAKEATDAMATIKTTLDMIARIFMATGPR